MKYFQHDLCARQSDKTWELLDRHGLTGYGLWWVVLEELYKAEDSNFCIGATETWCRRLSKDLNVSDWRTLPRILDTFAELGMIDPQLWAEQTIFAPSVIERGDRYIQKKAQTKARVQEYRDKKRKEKQECNALQRQCNAPVTPNIEAEAEAEANTDLNISLSSSLTHEAGERECDLVHGQKAIAHEQRAALEQNYGSAPQPLFPRRQIAVSVTPKFQGPWGEGHTPELDQFESWLKTLAIAKNKPDPDSWAFKVIDSIAKGGPHSMWNQFKSAEASDRPQPAQQRQTICEKLREDLKVDDPLSGYGGSTFRSFFNNLGYTHESRSAAFKRKYANYENLDKFLELAVYNGVLQPPTPDWRPTHPRCELEALVA